MTNEARICSRCVMDDGVSDIRFDEQGICNYCTEYLALMDGLRHRDPDEEKRSLHRLVESIKNHGKGRDYDCVLGVSGGLDSSFALYSAVKMGLRPLAVHLDNGWNSELAVSNIERLIKSLNVDLFTYIIDWEEFRDLQKAFIKANVIDIEMLTDHAILASLYDLARRRGFKYVLAGTNLANEGMRFPPGWNHPKLDLTNIRAIYRRHGQGRPLRTFPMMGLTKYLRYKLANGIRWISILDYLPYVKEDATRALQRDTGWRPYEKKHYESVFTRFYQGCILPAKFKVDKRRLHYSNLICSGQLSREEAVTLFESDPYEDKALLKEDRQFVLKKLGITDGEFEEYLHSPPVPHSDYPSSKPVYDFLVNINRKLSRMTKR